MLPGMDIRGSVAEVMRSAVLVAAAAGLYGVVRPSWWSGAGPATRPVSVTVPEARVRVPETSRAARPPSRGAPDMAAPTRMPKCQTPDTAVTAPDDVGSERAMRPDGRGGWYAVVEVVGRTTGPPRAGLDEYYGLHILGTCRVVELAVMDEFLSWWQGDQFVAHLIPDHRIGDTAESGLANLRIDGLVPIERGDTSTLEQVARGRRPMPSREDGWPREWHELVVAEVTFDRRWITVEGRCPSWSLGCEPAWIPESAGVGSPPPAANVGARYAFVFVGGKLTRSLGEVDPRVLEGYWSWAPTGLSPVATSWLEPHEGTHY